MVTTKVEKITDPNIEEEDDVPTPFKPPVFDLKAKRTEIKEKLHLDLKVPRWEGEYDVWVRYNPVDATRLERAIERRRESEQDEWSVLANADVLVQSCEGVFAIFKDDESKKKYSFKEGAETGSWTKFDPDLARALGMEGPAREHTAAAVARALYWTDGDLISAANEVIFWSTKASDRLEGDF